MVGVPSSRGCAACRRQKKKCRSDDDRPPCTRCKRLQIQCVGFGSQRLKFQDETSRFVVSVSENDATDTTRYASKVRAIVHPSNINKKHQGIGPLCPLNQTTLVTPQQSFAAAFIRGIDRTADISVQLPWNFGLFLEGVPRRLGHSVALDTAAAALLSVYSGVRAPLTSERVEVCLQKYAIAIKTLRQTLDNPRLAIEVETLCAINLLIVFETLSGSASTTVLQHSGGAAGIFKARGLHRIRDDFERQLLLSLRGPVVIHSLFLESDYFSEPEWQDLISAEDNLNSAEERGFQCLGRYVRLFQRTKKLISNSTSRCDTVENVGPSWQRLIQDLSALQLQLVPTAQELEERFSFFDENIPGRLQQISPEGRLRAAKVKLSNGFAESDGFDSSEPWSTLHAHFGRSLAFTLATSVLVEALALAINSTFESSSCNLSSIFSYDSRSVAWVKSLEIIELAEKMLVYQPLGSICMPFILRAAHVGISAARDTCLFGSTLPGSEPKSNIQLDFHEYDLYERRIRDLLDQYEQAFGFNSRSRHESHRGKVRDRDEHIVKAGLNWLKDYLTLRTKAATSSSQ